MSNTPDSKQDEAQPVPDPWRHLITTWVAMQIDYHKASDRFRAADRPSDALTNEARAEMLSWCSKELLAVVKRLPASRASVAAVEGATLKCRKCGEQAEVKFHSAAVSSSLPAEPPQIEICPVCKNEVPSDSMWSYNNAPNAFCQGCVDAGRV